MVYGDVKAFHFLEFQLSLPLNHSSLAAAKCRMDWHSGTSLPRMSWKPVVKMTDVIVLLIVYVEWAMYSLQLMSELKDGILAHTNWSNANITHIKCKWPHHTITIKKKHSIQDIQGSLNRVKANPSRECVELSK